MGDSERWSVGVFAAFVIACVCVSIVMSAKPFTTLELVTVATLTVIFLALGVLNDRVPPLLYFTTQLILAAAILGVFVRNGSYGIVWLILMPIVAQSVMLLPWPGILLVSAVSLSLFVSTIGTLGGISALAEPVVGFLLALFFVILFSRLAVREQRARQEVEHLARHLEDANRSLERSAAQAQELAASRERNRIAREIHDTIGHSLTVVNVQLEAAAALIDRDGTMARRSVDTARTVTRDALAELRRSVSALREDTRPLWEALAELATASETESRTVSLVVDGPPQRLSPELSADLYRVAQEALTNITRHSNATSATVALIYRDDHVRLSITDDGSETTPANEPGYGLVGIAERAALYGGSSVAETGPDGGFTITVEIPL